MPRGRPKGSVRAKKGVVKKVYKKTAIQKAAKKIGRPKKTQLKKSLKALAKPSRKKMMEPILTRGSLGLLVQEIVKEVQKLIVRCDDIEAKIFDLEVFANSKKTGNCGNE